MRKVALRLYCLVATSCCLPEVVAHVPIVVPTNQQIIPNHPIPVVRHDDSADAASESIASLVAVFHLGDTSHHDSSLSWLVGENATVFSAILVDEHGDAVVRIPRLPSDGKLMASLGLLSDVIVVALPSNFQSLEDVAETLLGIVRDTETRNNKLSFTKQQKCLRRLVLVSHAATDPVWVEELVQTHHLQQVMSPLFWDTFEIMTPENLRIQWNTRNLMGETRLLKELLPYENNIEAVSPLIKKVYETICGNEKIDLNISMTESFFELEAIAPPPKLLILGASDKTKNLTVSKSASFTSNDKEDPQDLVQSVLSVAQTKLYDLETDMQQVVMDNRMPMLDFGDKVNAILLEAYDKLSEFPTASRHGFLSRLVTEAHQLYMDQLQGLRDYYGRRYEACLDHENDKAAWTAEAEHLTNGFRAAATNAVPSLCRPDGVLAKILSFDFTSVLKGLVQDMIDATELRMDERSLAFDEDNGEDETLERQRFPPWVKKVASRVLALGINYLQGWLAWQGVKRAALERDREMPKFPLF